MQSGAMGNQRVGTLPDTAPWREVVGDFNVRGNIKTVVTARHAQKGFSPNGAPSVLSLE